MPQLALGTVQFGLDYGVANRTGQVAGDAARAILSDAGAAGIDVLDTAIAYGNSEAVLGQAGVVGWRVVTKLPGVPADVDDAEAWAVAAVEASRTRLKLDRLGAVLLHRPQDLLGSHGPALLRAFARIKDSGWAEKVGISIYDPEELEPVLGVFAPDLVQSPLNVIDRRLLASGWARRLKDRGVEIHCRSAFLQGLLLMTAAERPEKFARWRWLWTEWEAWLSVSGLSALQACLGYVMAQPEIDRVVVGVDSPEQLRQIVAASATKLVAAPDWSAPVSAELLNPSCWNRI